MIYTVTFNPSIDYFVSVPEFEMGKTNRTKTEIMVPGGKGLNVSLKLAELGVKSTALGFVAGYTGNMISDYADEKGIQSDFVKLREGNSRINVKFTSNDGTEINGNGPEIHTEELQELISKLNTLKEGDILVLSGSIPSSLPSDIYSSITENLKEKEIKIVVDATGKLLTDTLKYRPFLIKPNHHELGEIFNTKVENHEDAVKYGLKLQEMGAQNVLVSMGSKGSVFIAEDSSTYKKEAEKIKIVSSVGAGDSMVAGFIAGWVKTESCREAYEKAVETATRHIVMESVIICDEVEVEGVCDYHGKKNNWYIS